MTTKLRRMVAGLLIVCMGALSAPLPALAGIVGTETVIAGAERARLAALLERDELRVQLQALGVEPADARARVAALSDEEAARLVAEIDAAPAGGSDFLTVALIVFLVLLLTDIMGYTKIFPFTRSAK
ncbi:MAG: PA2779 family protein [Betaproteobacteria bacterium]|nr:PA2779 family protein [Betaproteobacteria bacterium]MDH5221385.1 PA2779 family protein [Betaproteobacteria bacterium]MDH5349957.1 PA2779 family protein [Betaproteobacteria bacterium]